MKTGVIFDIEECSIYEGNGLRVTIFMKGCPLRCRWCHSPEGQSPDIEVIQRKDGSRLTIGRAWSSADLARYMDRINEVFDGGFTFSGGDPLMQSDFLLETFASMKRRHDIIIETSGYGDFNKFLALGGYCSKIHFGMKNLDVMASRRSVGAVGFDQCDIIRRFDVSGVSRYDLIVPAIRGVTTTKDYRRRLNSLVSQLKNLDRISYIPYNALTYAKSESFQLCDSRRNIV